MGENRGIFLRDAIQGNVEERPLAVEALGFGGPGALETLLSDPAWTLATWPLA